MKINKEQEEKIYEDLEYIQLLHGMNKDDLRREAINQRDKALNLQAELDEMKFLLNDASEDLISISKAQNLIREDRKLNDIHYKGKIPRL